MPNKLRGEYSSTEIERWEIELRIRKSKAVGSPRINGTEKITVS